MPEDNRDVSRATDGSQAPEDIVWGHFGRCWRGEYSLLITFLTGTGVFAVVMLFFRWLEQNATEGRWSADVRFAVLALQLIAYVLASGWFAVGLLRSSRRYYRLGRRFRPIVAGIYGGLWAIAAAWIVVAAGPNIVATAISRIMGTYP